VTLRLVTEWLQDEGEDPTILSPDVG
jgi:hypothetical protein